MNGRSLQDILAEFTRFVEEKKKMKIKVKKAESASSAGEYPNYGMEGNIDSLQQCIALSSKGRARQGGVGVLGACTDRGQPRPGTQLAPVAMRAAGLLHPLAAALQVTDHGDLMADPGLDRQVGVARFGRAVAERVAAVLGAGQLAVTLGGDHSLSLGTLAASLAHDPDCIIIWVDAHADINTLSSSSSGHMHGMPVSFNISTLAESFPHPAELDWLVPRLQPGRLAYIGLRDVEPQEKAR